MEDVWQEDVEDELFENERRNKDWVIMKEKLGNVGTTLWLYQQSQYE